ncbi:MAG: DUF2273 domain-containing protein [Eubacteriales bacterium]|nr:DUF2273 domain-containing protein [Eubacteriales bacterium]
MADKQWKHKLRPGTETGKIFYTALFFAIGVLFATLGFWKALFVCALTAVGYFIGSTSDLGATVGDAVNKVVPPKNQKVEYTEEDLEIVKNMKKPESEPNTRAATKSDEQ